MIRYELTGEFRLPKKGECFENIQGKPVKAERDYKYLTAKILRRIETEEPPESET